MPELALISFLDTLNSGSHTVGWNKAKLWHIRFKKKVITTSFCVQGQHIPFFCVQPIVAAYLHKSLLLGLVLLPAFKCNSRKTFICVLTRHGNKTQLVATKHISAS